MKQDKLSLFCHIVPNKLLFKIFLLICLFSDFGLCNEQIHKRQKRTLFHGYGGLGGGLVGGLGGSLGGGLGGGLSEAEIAQIIEVITAAEPESAPVPAPEPPATEAPATEAPATEAPAPAPAPAPPAVPTTLSLPAFVPISLSAMFAAPLPSSAPAPAPEPPATEAPAPEPPATEAPTPAPAPAPPVLRVITIQQPVPVYRPYPVPKPYPVIKTLRVPYPVPKPYPVTVPVPYPVIKKIPIAPSSTASTLEPIEQYPPISFPPQFSLLPKQSISFPSLPPLHPPPLPSILGLKKSLLFGPKVSTYLN